MNKASTHGIFAITTMKNSQITKNTHLYLLKQRHLFKTKHTVYRRKAHTQKRERDKEMGEGEGEGEEEVEGERELTSCSSAQSSLPESDNPSSLSLSDL